MICQRCGDDVVLLTNLGGSHRRSDGTWCTSGAAEAGAKKEESEKAGRIREAMLQMAGVGTSPSAADQALKQALDRAADKAKQASTTTRQWTVDDVCRLIDHARERNVRSLRVGDLEFSFAKPDDSKRGDR